MGCPNEPHIDERQDACRGRGREGLRHDSDMTDAEWVLVAPLIPPAKRGGRKWGDVREVLNTIFYVLWTECQWKALPKDFPPRARCIDALGNPVALSLTPGQASDLSQAEPLLDEVEPRPSWPTKLTMRRLDRHPRATGDRAGHSVQGQSRRAEGYRL